MLKFEKKWKSMGIFLMVQTLTYENRVYQTNLYKPCLVQIQNRDHAATAMKK